MNIYLYELRSARKSFLIWNATIILLTFTLMAMYPSFTKDAEDFLGILRAYPPEALKALGVNIEAILSILGFFTYLLNYVLLAAAIMAMNLGIGIMSKEVRMRTSDFLMSKPVTRLQVVLAKWLTGMTMIIVTSALFVMISYVIVNIFKDKSFDLSVFLASACSIIFIQFFFLTLGMMVGIIKKKIKSVISLSLGIVFSFFVLGLFGAVIDDKVLRYLTPFKYFDFNYILTHGVYEGRFIVLLLCLSVLFMTVTTFVFQKKDIR